MTNTAGEDYHCQIQLSRNPRGEGSDNSVVELAELVGTFDQRLGCLDYALTDDHDSCRTDSAIVAKGGLEDNSQAEVQVEVEVEAEVEH